MIPCGIAWGDLRLVSQDGAKEVYTDTETGTTIWRLTTDPGFDRAFHYLYPGYSPDGQFIAFHCGGVRLCLMNSDGSNEQRPLGVEEAWEAINLSYANFHHARELGWWSKDARYLYTTDLVRVDVINGTVARLPSEPREEMFPFNWPMLSPNGLYLAGHNVPSDLSSCRDFPGGCKFRFIRVDGTDFWEAAVPPLEGGTGEFNVEWSPLGNDHLVYWTSSTAYGDYLYNGVPQRNPDGTPALRRIEPVLSIDRKNHRLTQAGLLNVDLSDHANGFHFGHFGHLSLSPDSYFMGGGAGLIGGHGWGFQVANSNFLLPGPERNLRKLYEPPSGGYDEWLPVGTHSNFSPDGTWYLIENTSCRPGMLTLYSMRGEERRHLARHRAHETYFFEEDSDPGCPNSHQYHWRCEYRPEDRDADLQTQYINCTGEYSWPTWSPDGTKVLFWSFHQKVVDPITGERTDLENFDVYSAIVKTPDPPRSLKIMRSESGDELIWEPARLHKEIKEYQIFQARGDRAIPSWVATVPVVKTFLREERYGIINEKQTTIPVDSTAGFPDQPVIEIEGSTPSRGSEILSCGGKTETSFIKCKRGTHGTKPSKHWNDSFVWKYTGAHGYHLPVMNKEDSTSYSVRAVEWSGLESELPPKSPRVVR